MKFQKTTLRNGLRIITVPMPSLKSATVLVMVGAGSRYETRLNNGISHFLEHMAFKGTEKRPDALTISTLIDGIGGVFNAFTSKEVTGYFIKSAIEHLELSIDLISDMLMNSKFLKEEIEKERGVIIEEINLYEDDPRRKIEDVYERLLYGDTPLGWDTAGEKEIIKKIQREDFLNYMSSLYSAKNMTIVVAGGINPVKIPKLVAKYFASMKSFDTVRYIKNKQNQTKTQVFIKKKKTDQIHLALGVRTVPISHPDHYPLSVLAAVLGGGMSSRLFHEIREKRGLAYYARSSADHYQDTGSLASFAGLNSEKVEEGISVMVEEYRKVKKQEVSTQELKKAKDLLKGHLILELEDSRAVSGFFAHQEIVEQKIETPEEAIAKVEKVTSKDLKRVANKYFINNGLNLALIGNFESGQKFEKLLKL